MPKSQESKDNFFLTAKNQGYFVAESSYDTLPIKKIMSQASEINAEKVAEEVLQWLAKNVEMFIDNRERFYHLDMIVDDTDPEDGIKMEETRKLQTLYRSIPDEDKEAEECHKALDEITRHIMNLMKKNDELLKALFKRMIYYYELQGFYQGNMIEKELVGEVAIHLFEYESFSLGVRVTEKALGNQKEVRNYVIPEGFIIEFEIAYRENTTPLSLF